MKVSPVRTARMVGCPKEWCELYWMDVVDVEIQYVVFDRQFYLWRGDTREVLTTGFNRADELPAGVEIIDTTIHVNGEPALTFQGESGPTFSVGYYPMAVS